MKYLGLIVSLLALMILPAQAQEQDPIRHGHTLAQEFCGSCHAIGAHGRSPHRAAPPLRNLGRTVDLDGFARVLGSGVLPTHPDMPQFKFHYQDALDLRDYLRTIQE